jgi:acyl carrier protein
VTTTNVPSPEAVLENISGMLLKILDQYGLDDVEITRETLFHDDLGLESIDLVQVGALLADQYGESVNLAAFLADKDLDEVIGLQVGLLVDFVVDTLSGARGAEA